MTRKLCLSARTLLVPVSVALSPFAFVTSAAAQSALAAPAAGQAETIVITATRTPTRASRVGSSVTVIDTPAIARAQSIPVIDLLRDVPGVAFSRTGGVGSLTTVRIRGAESDQTVLLIDGVKLNDPSGPGGGFNFANLLVGNLERIEVLRGPQSTLYDSQAMGGVVQIITRSGDEVGIDGFPAPSFVLADTLERSKTEELIVYTGANLTLLDGRSRTRFGISETQADRTNLNPTLAVQNTFVGNGTNRRAEFQSSLDVTPQFQIVGGGEFEQSRLRTASPSVSNPNPNPLRAKSELSALYLQGQASPASWLTATLGVRWTDHDSFGEALNTRATLAASLNQGNTIVRAALADGFKSPTPFQLFSNFGNAKLQPEEASSVEIGVEQAWFSRRLIGSITYFQRDTVNQIDFVSCFGNTAAICVGRPSGTYDNIARTKADGTEFTLEAKPTPQLSLSAGFATLDARNKVRGTANFNRLLPRRAKETGFTTIGYVFDFGLDVSATYSRIGDSFNNASNTVVNKGYDLVTLRASQKVNAQWTVFARVENAGDEIYETITGYGSPRRQTLVGLRATF